MHHTSEKVERNDETKINKPQFRINFLVDRSDESFLNELRRIASLLADGDLLSPSTYKRHSPKITYGGIRNRFGSWKRALELAGLSHLYDDAHEPRSKEVLIAELRRVHTQLGTDWLTAADFDENSIYSKDSVRRRFGSFVKGLEAAGIRSHPQTKAKQITDAECFENIAETWTHYGRPPYYREMFLPPSRVQGKTYISRWGTWRRVLEAFVIWANNEDGPVNSDGPQIEPTITSISTLSPKRAEADCRDVRPGLRFKVFQRDGFRCRACGRSPATHLNIVLHADHIVAVANGGKTIMENLQTLCQDCNLGKGRT